MGCSSINNSQNDLPIKNQQLSISFLPLQVDQPSLTSLFNKYSSIINEIENLRHNLIDKRDSLLFSTGACTIRSSNIHTILTCILQYMSFTTNADIKSINPVFDKLTEPYLSSKSSNSKVQSFQTEINSYIGFLLFFNDDYTRIKNDYETLMYNEIENQEQEWIRKACEGIEKGSEDEYNNKKACKKNFRKILEMKVGVESLLNELEKEYEIIINAWNKECNELTENEQLEEYDRKAEDAIKKNYKEVYEIAYYGVEEGKRLGGRPEEKYYEYEQMIRNRNGY